MLESDQRYHTCDCLLTIIHKGASLYCNTVFYTIKSMYTVISNVYSNLYPTSCAIALCYFVQSIIHYSVLCQKIFINLLRYFLSNKQKNVNREMINWQRIKSAREDCLQKLKNLLRKIAHRGVTESSIYLTRTIYSCTCRVYSHVKHSSIRSSFYAFRSSNGVK